MPEAMKTIGPVGSFVGLFANITEIMLGDFPTNNTETSHLELQMRRKWDKLRLQFIGQGINVSTAPELNVLDWPKAPDGSFRVSEHNVTYPRGQTPSIMYMDDSAYVKNN